MGGPGSGPSVGRVDLDLGLNYNAFNRELNSVANTAEGRVGGAFKGLGKIAAGAFVAVGIGSFIKSSMELASNLSEVQNVVDVTFTSMASKINSFAESALNSFGMSELSAKKYTSTIGAMLKSSGITGDGLVKMSTGVASLAGDMASFYNISQDDAFAKLRAGLSGETEPLKQLGVNMSVANMEAFALSKGIKKSYQEMNQAEQTLLRYNYLMNATKDAQGDFARTSGSWANQTRLLGEQWKIFKSTMGSAFISVLAPVVQALNYLIGKLQIAAQYFKAFIDMVFGAQPASSKATAATVSYGDALNDVGGAASGAGKDVKKAGKDVKGALSSFDQLNTLSKQTSDSLEDAAGGLGAPNMDMGGTPDIGVSPTVLDPVKQSLDGILDTARQVGEFFANTFGPPIQTAIDAIMPVIDDWKESLGGAFSDLLTLGEPLKNWFINDLVPYWQKGIELAGKMIAGELDSLRKLFDVVWDSLFPVLDKFVKVGLPLITDFASDCLDVFESMFDTSKHVFDRIVTEGLGPALELASTMIQDSLDIMSDFWGTWGDDICSGLSEEFNNISKIFDSLWDNYIGPVWENLLNVLTELWNDHLKGLVEELMTFIGKLVDGVLEIYNKFIVPIVDFLVKTLGPIFATIFMAIQDVVGTAIGAIIDIISGIFKFLGGLIDFIVGIFTGDWDKAWNGIKDMFSAVCDIIVSIFTGIWDTMSAIVEGAVEILDKIFSTIADAFKEFVVEPIKRFAQAVWDKIVEIFSSIGKWFKDRALESYQSFVAVFGPVKDFFQGVWNKIVEIFKGIGNWFKDRAVEGYKSFTNTFNAIGAFFNGIWAKITDVFKGMGTWFKNKAVESYKSFTGAFSAVSGFFKGVWGKITSIFSGIGGWFKEKFTAAWTGIKGVFNSVGSFFGGIWNTIKSKFVNVGVAIGNTVGDAFKGAINAVLTTIENIINGFFDLINNAIKTINDIPVVADIPLIQHIQVPKLANGGLVSAPTLAMVGDNKRASVDPEVVSPLSKLQDMLGASNQGVIEILLLILDAIKGGNKDLVLKVGETEFGRAAINAINSVHRQSGKTLLHV